MALTSLLVVASQIGRIEQYVPVVIRAVPIYVTFMILTPLLARLTVCAFRLDTQTGRALIFSAGTRNSLVVLPLALALPADWIVVPAVIVAQTLVELIGELFYIRLVPSVIFREDRHCDAALAER